MQSNVPSATLSSSQASDASNCSGEGGIGPGVALIMYFTSTSFGRCGDGSSISAAEGAMQGAHLVSPVSPPTRRPDGTPADAERLDDDHRRKCQELPRVGELLVMGVLGDR